VALIAVALAVAGALAATARAPEAGAAWRIVLVALMVGGSGLLVLALRRWSPPARLVLGVAVGLRLVVFPLGPSLSDDGYRYVWDGAVQAEGVSPYRFRPSDDALAGLQGRAEYERMNSPDYFSVYPPLSQAVFALGGLVRPAGWRASWWVIKAVVALAELGGVVCLVRLVGARGAALYAWHPLSVVEVAGQGHTEGLLVGVLGLFLLAVRQRPATAGAALASAVWAKLFPVALVPLVLRRPLAALAFGAVAVLLAAPYASVEAVGHVRQSLGLYLGTFDFYAAPYLALKSALFPAVGEAAGRIAAAGLAAAWAGVVAGLVLADDGTARSARRTVVGVVAAYALTASTLHPWHLLPLLFVAPLLRARRPAVWLASMGPLTYLGYVWPPAYGAAVAVGWGGGAALLLWAVRHRALRALMAWRGARKWARLRRHLPAVRPGGRLLDVGAGEGWVGLRAAADRGLGLTAVDVARYGRGAVPVRVYDGRRLPFASGAVDAALVVFVLHHARDPAAVVREAVRVTDGPVLVLETVWRAPAGKRRLEWADRLANRARSGGGIDEAPLDIRSDADWRRLFADLGVTVEHAETWGRLHPQALYRLRGQGATASRSEPAVAVRASSQSASG
jgi:SAM-dependent methyltransferase